MSLQIRHLSPDEYHTAFDAGLSFQQECESLRDRPDLDGAVERLTLLYDAGMSTVIAAVDSTCGVVGLLQGICSPDLFSGVLIAQEMVWYVKPSFRGCGLQLIDAFEEWARDQGAKYATMCHMADSMPEKLSSLYLRRGYKKQDTIYRKELC